MSHGTHTITAAAVDSHGRTGTATITVGIVARIDLIAHGRRVQGRHQVDLFWQGPTTRIVDIYRDGELLATVENSGFHLDNIGTRRGATYAYQVCERTPQSAPTPPLLDTVTSR